MKTATATREAAMQPAPRRRRPGVQPGTILLGLVGLSLLGWAAVNSPLFGTRTIEVRGVRRLDPDDIRRMAGVAPGTNLFRVSVERVAASLERDPWIADASASRSLPSTLVISVAERRPVGWLRDPDGRAVVAADGTILGRSASAPRGLPWVGRSDSPLAPGTRLGTSPVGLDVARALANPVLPQVRTVTVVGEEILILLRGGGEVLYGRPERLAEKSRAIDSMLRWADQQGVEVASIDVRIPESPALRPVS